MLRGRREASFARSNFGTALYCVRSRPSRRLSQDSFLRTFPVFQPLLPTSRIGAIGAQFQASIALTSTYSVPSCVPVSTSTFVSNGYKMPAFVVNHPPPPLIFVCVVDAGTRRRLRRLHGSSNVGRFRRVHRRDDRNRPG